MLFAPNKLERYEYIRYGPELTRLPRYQGKTLPSTVRNT